MKSKNNDLSNFYWRHYPLKFKKTIGTSRGSLNLRDTYFLIRENPHFNDPQDRFLIGEVGYLPGLTLDDWVSYSTHNVLPLPILNAITGEKEPGPETPVLRFAWEMLSPRTYFPDDKGGKGFYAGEEGISINGLIWMGDGMFQRQQIIDLLDRKFSTIKLKIGGLDFKEELSLLDFLFREAGRRKVEPTVRLDANGSLGFLGSSGSNNNQGFFSCLALERLEKLADYPIHSIEQPLSPLYKNMISREEYRQVMKKSPIPIAWDEELIGIISTQKKINLLDDFHPHYLVLKPGVHGGFTQCEEWITLANERGIGWWITSALESSLGLTAIARWTARLIDSSNFIVPTTQGLGTGNLFSNNFHSPLTLKGDRLFYDQQQEKKMRKEFLAKVMG